MMRRLLPLLLLGSLGLNVGLLVQLVRRTGSAGPAEEPTASVCGWGNRTLSAHLELNREQTQMLEEGRQLMLQRIEPLRKVLCEKRRELYAVFSSTSPDEQRIDLLVADIARLQGEIERVVIDHALDVRKFFAPGQEARYRDLLGHVLCPGMLDQSVPAENACCGPEGCAQTTPCGQKKRTP